jgi:CRP-like cAMP-binding protein
MQEVHHAPGELIFEEGQPSDRVAFLLTGRVEVLKRTNGDEVVLGEVGAGEFVGEMGVIEGRMRGASVRAKSDVRLRLMSEAEFNERLGREPETALQIVLRLSERLRAVNARLAEMQAHEDDEHREFAVDPVVPVVARVLPPKAMRVRVLPGSDRVEDAVGEAGIEIEAFPFHVGRPARHREAAAPLPMGLLVPDERPFRLSRAHFSIVQERGGYAVRDVGSHLGTTVNGELIGQHAPKALAPLRPGENLVVAGGRDSPFAFRVILAEA